MSKPHNRGRMAAADHVVPQQETEAKRQPSVAERPSTNGRRTPFYDKDRRELRVGNRIVKCFTQKSDAQETILLTFEEENWLYRIDDPLTGNPGQDPKRRLGTAVANLNRRQREPLIQFGVAMQGTAVTWQFRTKRQRSDRKATGERQ